jgi:microcystin degradation protein MlrC
LKIFLANLSHETNSFSPLPTTRASFERALMIRRDQPDALARWREFPTSSGVVAAADAHGDELLPGLCTWAQPSRPLSWRDYEGLRDELLADLAASMPVDAVTLVLHGAMVAEGYPDCEGDLLGRVRKLVGARTPVGALLDLHGNVTSAMIASGAVLVACKEYPHVDYFARGQELHHILVQMSEGVLAPGTTMRRVPMLGLFGTTEGPMRNFVRKLEQSEGLPGILSVSAMHGFPWSDTENTGAAILVVGRNDAASQPTANDLADTLAKEFFELRHLAKAGRLSVDAAIDAALAAASDKGPVVIADGADNPGGGAACDSTFLLRALLEREVTNVALGMIWDPQAVAIASDAGVGAKLPLRMGGKVGPLSGAPVDLTVEVVACRSDAFQRGLEPGSRDALGPAVAVRAHGIDIVLNSIRQQVFSPDCFTELGVDVMRKRLVVVKSTQHYRAGFDALGVANVYCDAPGSLQTDLSQLPYQHLRRPIWPLDAGANLPASSEPNAS